MGIYLFLHREQNDDQERLLSTPYVPRRGGGITRGLNNQLGVLLKKVHRSSKKCEKKEGKDQEENGSWGGR